MQKKCSLWLHICTANMGQGYDKCNTFCKMRFFQKVKRDAACTANFSITTVSAA